MMRYSWAVGLFLGSTMAQAQTAPTGSKFMVPAPVVLRATSPAEQEAHQIWTLRAALNVAALQCQYSPFLRTVKNYNEMLRHHSSELSRAQATMQGHFRRYEGAKGPSAFDQYTTRTYNSFSTLDAQYDFCDAVGTLGREVLLIARGKLGASAPKLVQTARASLEQKANRVYFDPDVLKGFAVTELPPANEGRKGRRR